VYCCLSVRRFIGVFPMLLSVFLRPMTFDNPPPPTPTPTPGKDSLSYWRFPKIPKKSFRKNHSEIYTTDYSFGKTSERPVRQPLDNLKSRGDFWKSIAKIDIPPSFNKLGHFFVIFYKFINNSHSRNKLKTVENIVQWRSKVPTKFLWELATRK
jgi:hypothetical protein